MWMLRMQKVWNFTGYFSILPFFPWKSKLWRNRHFCWKSLDFGSKKPGTWKSRAQYYRLVWKSNFLYEGGHILCGIENFTAIPLSSPSSSSPTLLLNSQSPTPQNQNAYEKTISIENPFISMNPSKNSVPHAVYILDTPTPAFVQYPTIKVCFVSDMCTGGYKRGGCNIIGIQTKVFPLKSWQCTFNYSVIFLLLFFFFLINLKSLDRKSL